MGRHQKRALTHRARKPKKAPVKMVRVSKRIAERFLREAENMQGVFGATKN